MIKGIAILGGGLMGSQIALFFNSFGLNVTIFHKSPDSRLRCDEKIANLLENVSWKRHVKSEITIKHCFKLNEIGNSDLIIECIDENLDAKKKLFADLLPNIKGNQIIASNSSTMPMSLFLPENYSGDYVNLHFFNPLLSSRTVEISSNSGNYSQSKLIAFLESIGLSTIQVRNKLGFLINKISIPFWVSAINEFGRLNSNSEKFDLIFKKALAHNCGPLEVADIVGFKAFQETCLHFYKLTNDKAYKPPFLISQMIAAGYVGKINGKGFYIWENDKKIASGDLEYLKLDKKSGQILLAINQE
jgi:3-hydroxybutyryl-CoA dehydrogenase